MLTNIPKGKKQPFMDAMKAAMAALDKAQIAATFAHRPGLGVSISQMARDLADYRRMIHKDNEEEE